jgi:cytoskeleton protein RodZ
VRLVSFALAAAVIAVIALWWHDRPEVAPELETETAELDPDAIAGSGSRVRRRRRLRSRAETPETATGSVDPDRPDSRCFTRGRSLRPRILAETTPRPPAALASSESEPDLEPASAAASHQSPKSHRALQSIRRSQVQTDAPAQAPSEPPVDTPVLEPLRSGDGIVLEFTGPSWLEVRDAAGERLIVGEMKAGDRREVTGPGPFRFTVGRVNNSSMTVDGTPFDLEARSRGNVARFSLDPESPE